MPRETYVALAHKMHGQVMSMSKEKWAPRSDGWELVERPLPFYLDEYVEKYRATGPDRSNLKQALQDFRKKNKANYPNFIPKLSNASEAELQKRMQHADACLTAMAQVVLEEEDRMRCMYDTIGHLFGKNGTAKTLLGADWQLSNIPEKDRTNIAGQLDAMRGFQEMMDTGDGPEAQEHNERIVMLMALNERKISEADYRTIRESQLAARYPQDYREKIQHELDHSFDELFDTIQRHVEAKRTRRNSPEMKKHFENICDVNETDPTTLRDAYRAIFESSSAIGTNGTHVERSFESMYKNRDGSRIILSDNQKKLLKQWEDDDCEYGCKLAAPTAMANPYSAILDQQELTDFMLGAPVLPPRKNTTELSALSDFCAGIATFAIRTRESESYKAAKEAQTRELLERTGMQDAVKTDTIHPEIHVYEKDGRKLIVRNEHDVWGDPHIRADVPGQLINYDLQVRLSELDELCVSRDQGRGSTAYTNMRIALHEMQDAALSDNPSADELDVLQQKFENLQEKVNLYMERKRRQRVAKGDMEVVGGSPYEKQRISFARELQAFTQDKLAAIQSIRVHQTTMQHELDAADVDLREPAMRELEEEQIQRVRTSIVEITEEKNAEAGMKALNEKMMPKKSEKKEISKSENEMKSPRKLG